MTAIPCPTGEQLKGFALGLLSEPESDAVGTHVDACRGCEQRLLQVDDRSDALLVNLRHHAKQPPVAPIVVTLQATSNLASHRVQHGPTVVSSMATIPPLQASAQARSMPPPVHARAGKNRRRRVRSTSRRLAVRRRLLPDWGRAWCVSAVAHITLLLATAFLTIAIPFATNRFISLVLETPQPGTGGPQTLQSEKVSISDGQGLAVIVAPNDDNSYGQNERLNKVPPRAPDQLDEPDGTQLPGKDRLDEGRLEEHADTPIGDGAAGNPHVVVKDYREAMHQLTRDLLDMLRDSSVLVIWCFDRSGSMNDDRETIHGMLGEILEDLDREKPRLDFVLSTAVTGYGAGFHDITGGRPLEDSERILDSVGAVGSEDTGTERMCSAVYRAIEKYSRFAHLQKHRMAVVVVTDESGDYIDSVANLETVVDLALRKKTRVYTIGREAVFGHREAYVMWTNPETRNTHPVPIDLGPESPFIEQLLTDGFGPRKDAHPSGFGPYEQRRLAWKTGGKFFLLEGEETKLQRDDNSRYLEANVRAYKPSVLSRAEYRKGLKEHHFKLMEIVHTLDPHDPQKKDLLTLEGSFSPRREEFLEQANRQVEKAVRIIDYIEARRMELEALRPHREKETSPRWKANYDLINAQLATYVIRLHQYCLCLQNRLQQGTSVTLRRQGNQHLFMWKSQLWKEWIPDDFTSQGLEHATALLQAVRDEYPGTPWAARAERELEHGFGVQLLPSWHSVGKRSRPSVMVPKM